MSQQILSQEEVDALLNGMSSDSQDTRQAGEAPEGVREYDIANQERIIRGRMPTMEVVNERFARNIRVGLFNLLRKSPEVTTGTIKVHKFGAFLRGIVVPSNFNVVSVKPLRGNALIVFDPSLVLAVIDGLFGGAGRSPARIDGRDFSPTELRIIERLVETVLAEYHKSWAGIYPLKMEFQRAEMQPQFANIANPGETVVSTSFDLEIGENVGAIHFCYPYATLEPIRDVLGSTTLGDSAEVDRRWIHLLKTQIQDAELEIVVDLGQAEATVAQLLALKPGDFIELDSPSPLQAKVEGVPLIQCHHGTSNGHYAIRVQQMLAHNTDSWNGAADNAH